MRLKTLKLQNFRGYKDETIIPIDSSLTAFIGKNDIGKSTILEALDIFFNKKIETNDFCKYANEDESIVISCTFDNLPENIIIDTDNPTDLRAELLVNQDGDLEIIKEFSGKNKTTENVYLNALFPSNEEYRDVLEKTNTELKKLANGLLVQDNKKNADLRRAIRESLELEVELQKIPVKKNDSKNIWEALANYLPLYALFKSDRSSSDQDSEVQDPMKTAVEMALQEVQTKLLEIEEEVQKKALDVAKRTVDKLGEMDPELAKELMPEFKEKPKWNGIFKLSLTSDDSIPLNKRGSGVRRLILLNFFRAEAERQKEKKKLTNVIFAIEEPETSQHPNNQELILKALMEIALAESTQVILTTHVPALASLLPLESLRFITKEESSKFPKVEMPSEDTYNKIAETLGVLANEDIATAKAVVLVEGHTDIIFLHHSSEELKNGGFLTHTLDDLGIVPIMTGGCGNLKHWVNSKLLSVMKKPYCVFYDSDKQCDSDLPGGKNQKVIAKLKGDGVKVIFTRKREIENYFSPELIGLESIEDFDDVKKLTNSKILEKEWRKMTAEMIQENDKYTVDGNQKHEIVEILQQICSITGIKGTVDIPL